MRSTQAHSYLGSLICAVIQVCPLEKSSGCLRDRKSTRLNSSHLVISYAVFCLKKKKQIRSGYRSYRSPLGARLSLLQSCPGSGTDVVRAARWSGGVAGGVHAQRVHAVDRACP